MKFNVKMLKEIFAGDFRNVSDGEFFSFLNIAVPTGDLVKQIDKSKELFFTTYETDHKKDGWIEKDLDRRTYDYDEVYKKNPNMTVITDDNEVFEKYKNSRPIIFVESLPETIEKIYNYVLSKAKPQVIALTGSVGKTTAMSLMEDVVKTEQPILRLYSKRITPLNLSSMIINFLQPEHKFLALEMSMNRKRHVADLAQMLPPDFSGIINITTAHMGTEDIENQNDIWESKSKIFTKNGKNFINLDDKISKDNYKSLNFDNIITIGINKEYNPDFRGKLIDGKMLIFKHNEEFLITKLQMESDLSMYQALFTTAIADNIGISKENIANAISHFSPKENRLQKYIYNDKEVFFDGDASASFRLLQLSKNSYEKPTLIITNYSDHESQNKDTIPLEKEELRQAFENFGKVFVAENIKSKVIDAQIQKFQIFKPEELTQIMNSANGPVFLHHSVYYREKIDDRNNGAYKQCHELITNLEKKKGISLILRYLLDNSK